MPTFLRFLMLLSLVVWIGGIIFFSFVVAPTVFSVLPTRHLAGAVVNRSLATLHWMGIFSGVVFVVASLIYTRMSSGAAYPFAARHLLVYLMLLLTIVSHFGIAAKMATLRTDMGEIDRLSQDDTRRVQFNKLHAWSTRLEGTVFFLGLAVLFLTARRLS
ncbi:MAG TPA: DUF4149 domain-containing protein [Clostridia bacterium]|nr:DUF4149 domain-containing protein [Clostridia bacterium]